MEVEEYYDRVAGRYDSDTKTPLMSAEDNVLFSLMGIAPHHRVLDAGCGTGIFYDMNPSFITKENYVGYDISQKMIDVYSKKCANAKLLKMSFLDSHLKFAAKFDRVLCLYGGLNALNDIYAISEAIRNLWSSVAPGGRMILVPYGTVDPLSRETSVHNIFSDQVDGYPFLHLSFREWGLLFEKCLPNMASYQIIPFSEQFFSGMDLRTQYNEEYYENHIRLDVSHRFKEWNQRKLNANFTYSNVQCDFFICDIMKEG